jgi:4-amino-4-deoxy-L-arabinose transferase-like glycosyltransferase
VTEREWREAADLQPMRIALLLALLLAAGLRFIGISNGIPHAIGVDEPEIMARVVHMMKTGDLNPHFFDYPGLLFYLHLCVAVVRFMVGAIQGRWGGLTAVGPDDFYLWARCVTALFGTATVFVVYLAGLRWGVRHAVLGAGMLAVMPMHVRESHFVLTDVPMTFFVTLAWVLSMSAHERGTWSAFALAGAAAGLATSCKYTAGLVIVVPLIAVWMTVPTRPSRLAAAVATVAAAAAAFLVTSPYTVLDLPAFLNDFANLVGHFQTRSPDLEPGWLVYLKHLRLNFQWPATILLATGLVLATERAVRGPGRVKWTLIAVFPVLFFVTIADRAQLYGRYLLPAVPFACVLIGISVVSGVSLLRRFAISRAVRTLLITALTVAALLPPARVAFGFVTELRRPSTQDAAWTWISVNIPPAAAIVVEKRDLHLPEARYRVQYVKRLIDTSVEEYRAGQVQYLIATSQVYGPALTNIDGIDVASRYRTLFRSTREVARFTPNRGRPGPELRILALDPPQ